MAGVIIGLPPLATEVGLAVLRRGGNAVDAAVATAFAEGALDPWNCGVGGLGTASVYWAETGENVAVQFYARAGSLVLPDLWLGESIPLQPGGELKIFPDYRNDIGYTACGVPGEVAGLWELHQRWGNLPWAALIEPAIRLLEDGWLVTPTHAEYWRIEYAGVQGSWLQRMSATPASAALYLRPDGSILKERDRYRNPELAGTLERIATDGPDVFYRGRIAQQIADDFATHGGFLTVEDLAGYQARVVQPLSGDYRGYRVTSDPPPGGGLALLLALRILEGFPLGELEHNGAEHLHLVTIAVSYALACHRRYVGDPAFTEVPADCLLSDEHVAECRRRIESGEPAGLVPEPAGRHTTQICVIDAAGNAVTMTHTLGVGSGVVVPGLGFVFNNAMAWFVYDDPSHPSAPGPGKARPSQIAPTMVFRPDGSLLLAAGAPGGDYITSAMVQTIVNVLDFGMSALEAVSAPRAETDGGPVKTESRLLSTELDELERRGHVLHRSLRPYRTGNVGASVHLVMRDEQGRLSGGADPRWYGSVGLIPG